MKTAMLSAFLLIPAGWLRAENPRTYYYRIDKSRIGASVVKNALAGVETKNWNQPYVNTHVLETGDTNYYLISLTPNNNVDFQLESRVTGVALWKVTQLDEDGFFRTLIDNSELFPVDRDWSVKKSS